MYMYTQIYQVCTVNSAVVMEKSKQAPANSLVQLSLFTRISVPITQGIREKLGNLEEFIFSKEAKHAYICKSAACPEQLCQPG